MIDIDKPEIDEDAEMAEEAEIAKANADITAEVMKRLEAWNGESVDDIVRDLEKLIASGTTEDLAEAEAVLADRSLVPFPSGPRNSSAFDWWGIECEGSCPILRSRRPQGDEVGDAHHEPRHR
jgi:hypothetical protein